MSNEGAETSGSNAPYAPPPPSSVIGGGCPVDHSQSSNNSSSISSRGSNGAGAFAATNTTQPSQGIFSLSSWWSSTTNTTTTTTTTPASTILEASSCPVVDTTATTTSTATTTTATATTTATTNSAPASLEEAAAHAQTPLEDQTLPLRTARQVSSIPRGDVAPPHQVTATAAAATDNSNRNNNNWIYPSEQQLYVRINRSINGSMTICSPSLTQNTIQYNSMLYFYTHTKTQNAMRRKGWKNVPEDSVAAVLHIHNNINEGTWKQIMAWESFQDIKLAKFQGRPSTLTPKAFLLTKVLRLYEEPFDRHDWYVENTATGHQQRYVIDYYGPSSSGSSSDQSHVTGTVDVRPALDDARGVYLRGQRCLQDAFPGLTAYSKRVWQKQDTAAAMEQAPRK